MTQAIMCESEATTVLPPSGFSQSAGTVIVLVGSPEIPQKITMSSVCNPGAENVAVSDREAVTTNPPALVTPPMTQSTGADAGLVPLALMALTRYQRRPDEVLVTSKKVFVFVPSVIVVQVPGEPDESGACSNK
jgi:hypothetical protein